MSRTQEKSTIYKELKLGANIDELASRYREIFTDIYLIGQLFDDCSSSEAHVRRYNANRICFYVERMFRSREDLLLYLGLITSVKFSPKFPYRSICEENQVYFNFYFLIRGQTIFSIFKQLNKKDQKQLQEAILDQSLQLFELNENNRFEESLKLSTKYRNYPRFTGDFFEE